MSSKARVTAYTQKIRDLREESHLSQKAVANILGVAQTTYSDYEHGYTRIPVEHLIRLAAHYNVDLNYITGASAIKQSYPEH